ncbi:MAG TPA: histidine kinase [Chloroflexia bacterium]|nr:histidine kinase [Chloroflexia bacterium]
MAKSYRLFRNTALPLRHSLAGRILVGFLMMAFLSLVVALAGIYYTSQASSKLVDLLEQDRKFTTNALTMKWAAEWQNSSVRAYLLKYDANAEKELSDSIKTYEDADKSLREMLASLNLPPDKYEQVKYRYEDYRDFISYIRSLNPEEYTKAPIFLWENTGQRSGPALKNQLIQSINDVLNTYRESSQKQIEDARQTGLNVTIVALTLVTVAGILGAFVASVITRSITRPLRKLAGVAREIRQGNLSVHVPVMRGEDEVASLAGAMASMAENLRASRLELENSLEESRRSNRELSAANRVAATIGQSLDLDQVLHEALDELMSVAEMEYGSIFLMEPDGKTLRLSTFKNQTEDYIRGYNRVKVGEQITGQVAESGEVTMLEFPMEDPRVTNPTIKAESFKRFYLGVPFKSKGKVVGVANLTSNTIKHMEKRDLELLRAIGNQIGIAVDNAQLYQQASALAAVDERNRLARDLHDSVTQTLFSITLTAESAKAMMLRKPEKVETQIDRLQILARGALAEMRSLIFQLRPAALQEQGLVAALEKHIAALKAKELDIDLNVEGARRLSDEHEQALYRIAQEAFNNIVKHARATHSWVDLKITDEGVSLTIRDNGEGFDAASVMAKRDRSSLGLTSMRERAELAGGTYTIESSPGEGTTVSVYLPLDFAPKPVGIGINNSNN